MQYRIDINQLELAKTELDLVDAAILDYLYHLCSSPSPKIERQRNHDEDGAWTWVSYQALVDNMPLLRLKKSGAITAHVTAIKDAGFIVTKRIGNQRLYVRLLEKIDELFAHTNGTVRVDDRFEGKAVRVDERTILLGINSSTITQSDAAASLSDTGDSKLQPIISSKAVPTGSASDRSTPTPSFRSFPLPQDDAAPEAPQQASEHDEAATTPAGPPKPSQADYRTVLDHVRSVQHIEKEWPNYPAQMKAVKALFSAGYLVEELSTLADLMAKDTYWKTNPFSAINMVSNAHRYAGRLKQLTEEPPMTAFEIKEEERRRTLELARQYDREHGRG